MKTSDFAPPFLRRVTTRSDKADPGSFPFNRLGFLDGGAFELELKAAITILVGDHGSGKSTLLEAIAKTAGFPPMGGSRDHQAGADGQSNTLAEAMRLSWLPKVNRGFFFRAESFFGLADYLDREGDLGRQGGHRLGQLSHGEAS